MTGLPLRHTRTSLPPGEGPDYCAECSQRDQEWNPWPCAARRQVEPLPLHRTAAGYPNCSTCDGGGCPDCTDPS